MDYRPTIRDAASKLGLLTPAGELANLDSLRLMEFILELEAKTNLVFPPEKLVMESFETIEAVNALLEGAHTA